MNSARKDGAVTLVFSGTGFVFKRVYTLAMSGWDDEARP